MRNYKQSINNIISILNNNNIPIKYHIGDTITQIYITINNHKILIAELSKHFNNSIYAPNIPRINQTYISYDILTSLNTFSYTININNNTPIDEIAYMIITTYNTYLNLYTTLSKMKLINNISNI